MKRFWKTLILTALVALAPAATFGAANSTILLVFNGNTEVNRHTYNFVREQFQALGANYTVNATLDPSTVKPNTYKAVVVISTSTTTGVDPVLGQFMKSYSAPQEIYLVDLFSRSSLTTATSFSASSNVAGVDGVSAATTWGRGFGGSNPIQMQQAWVKKLAEYLAKK